MKINFWILGLLCAFACGCSEDGSTAGDNGGDDSTGGTGGGQTTTPDDNDDDDTGGGTTPPTYVDALDKVHEKQPGETYDWDAYDVPAVLPAQTGKEWVLSDQSDDFNYNAPTGSSKGVEFDAKWNPHYVQKGWYGPSPTVWNPNNSYIESGALNLVASREAGEPTVTFTYNGKSYTMPKTNTGCISSKKSFTYPLYIETRAKVARTTVASAVWMLSGDALEEIDIIEGYGGDRSNNKNFTPLKMHLSHHVFVNRDGERLDYQPKDQGTYHADVKGTNWADGYHRVGVFWRDPFYLGYYIDGKLVRVVQKKEMIDPNEYRGVGKGLSQNEFVIFSQGDQTWRAVNGMSPTAAEISNAENNTFKIDWIRIYEAKAK